MGKNEIKDNVRGGGLVESGGKGIKCHMPSRSAKSSVFEHHRGYEDSTSYWYSETERG